MNNNNRETAKEGSNIVINQNFENYNVSGRIIYSDIYINKPENQDYNPEYVHSGTTSICRTGKKSGRGAFSLFDKEMPELEIGKK